MTISLVVAVSSNNAIGLKGKLLWHLPADLKHFKNVTWGMPVIMGRKTYDSLGKALPGRKNIVITRQKDWKADGVMAVQRIYDSLFVANETDAGEVMVIGGGEIYKAFFERAQRIYLTRVEATPEADSFFPEIDPAQWRLVSQKDNEADEKNMYNYSFQIWERI